MLNENDDVDEGNASGGCDELFGRGLNENDDVDEGKASGGCDDELGVNDDAAVDVLNDNDDDVDAPLLLASPLERNISLTNIFMEIIKFSSF